MATMTPPAFVGPPPPRRDRSGRLAVLAFVLVVALCAGGGTGAYFLIRGIQPKGWGSPREAVDGFLDAVFNRQDPAGAAEYVCPGKADPNELNRLVETAAESLQNVDDPDVSWEVPSSVSITRGQGTLDVTLNVTDAGSPVTTKRISLEVADQQGWWVCGVGPLRNG